MAVLAHFEEFNSRRYSKPWVATIKNGEYNFDSKPGYYTGNISRGTGEAGDLIVTDPKEDIIYAFGQKDGRGGNTRIKYAIWNGSEFIKCDKAGREIEDPQC